MSSEEKKTKQVERDRAMDEKLVRDYYDKDTRAKRRKNVRIGFVVCLAILLVATLINWGAVTNWGQIKVDRVNVTGDDGGTYSALVYVPANATDETPAPAILCYHGNSGSGRNHESWAIEFARRGFVVVSPDLYGAGDAQTPFDEYGLNGRSGKIDTAELWYKYVMDLPIVDADNIIASGHSAGGEPAQYLGAKYDAKAIMNVSGAPNGMFDDGFADEWMETWQTYQGNYVYLIGQIETVEGGGRNDIQAMGLEALSHYPQYSDITEIESGKVYGSFEDGDAVVFKIETRVHEAAFVNEDTIGDLLEYGQASIGDAVPNYIDSSDQVWMYKDFTGLFGMFAFVAFLCSLALLLIEEVPAFAYVRRPLARNVGFRGIGLVLATIVGFVAPWIVLKTDAFGIIGGKAYANLEAAGFAMGYANMGFGIIVGLSLFALLGFIIYLVAEGKKKGLTVSDFGLTPFDYAEKQGSGQKARAIASMALRTLLLAAIVVAIGWGYIQLQLMLCGTDFYGWFFGVKDIPLDKVPYYWNYLLVFILCFFVLAIDMNVIRRLPSTGKETLDVIIGMVVNFVVGCAVVIAIIAIKWQLQTYGNPLDDTFLFNIAIDFTRILGMPVGMTVATTGATFIYKKTGNLWLCAFLIGTVACLMGMLYGQTRFHF